MNRGVEAAALRLAAAVAKADERDRCSVSAMDVRAVLRELADLQETLTTVELIPELVPRD